MQTIILGSGVPFPHPDRAGASTLVRTSAGDLLFDCGRAVLMRAAAVGAGAGALRALFLTHLHSDHITDLNDVMTTRWIMSLQPNPLTVYGPPGTAALVAATEAMLEPDIGYRLEHHDDLTWRPSADVTECERGRALQRGHRPRQRRTDGSRAGTPDRGVSRGRRRVVRRDRGRHRAVHRPRRALCRRRHARAHRDPPRPPRAAQRAAAQRHLRLPLDSGGCGAHGGAGRGRHARAHAPRSGAGPSRRRSVGGTGRGPLRRHRGGGASTSSASTWAPDGTPAPTPPQIG